MEHLTIVSMYVEMYLPGAEDLLMETALAALTLSPQAGKLLLQGGEVRHLLLVEL